MGELPQNPSAIRDADEKTPTGEVIPDKQTLSTTRLGRFLEDKVTVQSFEKDFNLQMAMDFTAGETSDNGKALHQLFTKTKDVLDSYDAGHIFDIKTKSTISQRLDKMQRPPTNMPRKVAMETLQAWDYYNYIRRTAKRYLSLQERSSTERREMQEGSPDAIKDAKTTFNNVMTDVKKNWDKWGTGEKLLFSGVALVGAAWLATSDHPTLKRIKKGLGWVAGGVAGGFLLWKGYELFTGESPASSLESGTRKSTKSADFYKRAFECTDEQEDALVKTICFIGNKDFIEVARAYQSAKNGSKSVEGMGMDGKEAFEGLDVFFKKYPINRLRDKFRNENPPLTYAQVINVVLAEDPSVQIYDNAGTNATRYIGETVSEATDWAAGTYAGIYLRETWSKYVKGEPNPEEMDKLKRNFRCDIPFTAEMPKAIDGVIARDDFDVATSFKDAWNKGRTETNYDLKHYSDSEGYIYVISDVDVASVLHKDELLKKNLTESESNAQRFLSNKFSKSTTEVSRDATSYGHVFCAQNGKAYHFMRYKA